MFNYVKLFRYIKGAIKQMNKKYDEDFDFDSLRYCPVQNLRTMTIGLRYGVNGEKKIFTTIDLDFDKAMLSAAYLFGRFQVHYEEACAH